MSTPHIDVEQVFGDFLEEYGAEISDKTLSGSNKPTNPDYIFHQDKVIAELKLLKTDPFTNKEFINSFVEKKREWINKDYISEAALEQIRKIDQLPDRCYNDIIKLYMRPVKTHVGKANDQIKKTKARLVLCKVSHLISIASCRIFSAWQEQHNPSHYQMTNEVL